VNPPPPPTRRLNPSVSSVLMSRNNGAGRQAPHVFGFGLLQSVFDEPFFRGFGTGLGTGTDDVFPGVQVCFALRTGLAYPRAFQPPPAVPAAAPACHFGFCMPSAVFLHKSKVAVRPPKPVF
jgi:hypothetical protein